MKNELDRYLGQIRRCLRVDKATRERILNDLTGDLYDRLRRGESAADIIADMGPAREVADGFNENFAAEGQPARLVWRPWGWRSGWPAGQDGLRRVCCGTRGSRGAISCG